ncbi:MAG: hypothetical protein GWP35_06810 [Proteobacteria bacterium]|nr:hypothetical protein [Pseudomonadota bacterium]
MFAWMIFMVTLLQASQPSIEEPALTSGPVVGRVTTDEVRVWCRVDQPNRVIEGILLDSEGVEVCRSSRTSSGLSDLTVELVFSQGIRPQSLYNYQIIVDGIVLEDGKDLTISTPPVHGGMTRFVFGSCGKAKYLETSSIWNPVKKMNPHMIFLLGDTPYIDSTDLAIQRKAYREFWRSQGLSDLARSTSFAATWDDHDYGKNDTVGDLKGRHLSRKAFREYHAMGPIGDKFKGGIFSSFRWGEVEVFLIDARWFGNTEPSPMDPEKPTLLGKTQWEWLQKSLKESKATFKVISSGMVFNGSVRPGKKDHWMNWPHERNGLLKFIGDNKISGVLIVTGDIHRCRHLSYPPSEGAGYAIDEWITSPLASTVISTAKVDHPALVFDGGEPRVFLGLEVDATTGIPKMKCQLITDEGLVIHQKTYTINDLSVSAGD